MKSSSVRARATGCSVGVAELAVQIRQPFPAVRPCAAVEHGISGAASGYPETLRDELRRARVPRRRARAGRVAQSGR